VTDCPDAPVSLMAAVPVGDADDPDGVTYTWNEGPAAGAGAQLNAQPMFHGATVVVNTVLVQFPLCWGESRSTRAGPAAAPEAVVAVVEPPATVVVVAPPTAVVVVAELPPAAVVVVVADLPPGAVVVVAEPPEADAAGVPAPSAGRWPPSGFELAALDPPPVSPLIHMPTMAATSATLKSCHVRQDLRSLILSSPAWGTPSDAPTSGGGTVIDLSSETWAVRSTRDPPDSSKVGTHRSRHDAV
jgi:hypothetical protein